MVLLQEGGQWNETAVRMGVAGVENFVRIPDLGLKVDLEDTPELSYHISVCKVNAGLGYRELLVIGRLAFTSCNHCLNLCFFYNLPRHRFLYRKWCDPQSSTSALTYL